MIYKEENNNIINNLIFNKYNIGILTVTIIFRLYYEYYKNNNIKYKEINLYNKYQENEKLLTSKGLTLNKLKSKGLINSTGNNCFLNSIIQAYSSLPSLIYFIKKIYIKCKTEKSYLFLREFMNLIILINSENGIENEDPIKLIKIISDQMENYNYFISQQDCHELIKIFNQFLTRSINEIYNKDKLYIDKKINNNYINPLLGELSIKYYCSKCKFEEKEIIEEFDDISLNMIDNNYDNIYNLINNFFKDEYVKKYCINCSINSINDLNEDFIKSIESDIMSDIDKLSELFLKHNIKFNKINTNFLKKSKIKKFPQILNIHFQRLVYDNNGNLKNIKREVNFENILILNNKIYNLRSIIVHYGNENNGHYICIKRNWISTNPFFDDSFVNINGKYHIFSNWNLISDTEIRKINYSEIKYLNPYILFYELEI